MGEKHADEQWRATRYEWLEVSSRGRVRSRRGRNGRPLPAGRWRVCELSPQSKGYLVVGVGEKRTELVHRLVLEAFHGPRPVGQEGRHLDGDKANNRADNLAWGTPAENATDRAVHGTVRGQRLSARAAGELKRRLRDGGRAADLAREFEVPYKTVHHIRAGHTWGWLDPDG